MNGTMNGIQSMSGHIDGDGSLNGRAGATSVIADYNRLTNKPRIEGCELVGNKTYGQLNLNFLTNMELEELLEE